MSSFALNEPKSVRAKHALDAFHDDQSSYSRWSGLMAPDKWLLLAVFSLCAIGLVMVASASMPTVGKTGNPMAGLNKQMLFMGIGFVAALIVYHIPTRIWYEYNFLLLFIALAALILVLVPGIGREINNSRRWIYLGPIGFQVSEFARICVFVYAAAYLYRHQKQIHNSWSAMLKLLGVLGVVAILLLKEPDFGSTAVITATVLGMMYLAGVCIFRFTVSAGIVAVLAIIALLIEPYRRARLSNFLSPWDDPFGDGYQLTQSLIAIGRGELTGVGIGESIQKHNYLPMADTDFIFAIYTEETGLIGAIVLLGLYSLIVYRAFVIGHQAEKVRMRFASCLAYGTGLWIGMQSLINMSVASGMLPTKGLTLPLISSGGSSVLACFILLGILARIDSESKYVATIMPETVKASNTPNSTNTTQVGE